MLNNKLSIFTRYYKEVLRPIAKHEQKDAAAKAGVSAFNASARRALKRHPSLLKQDDLERINVALSHSEKLKQAYHFRDRLNQIWSKTYSSNQELIASFQEWCHQAEKTGIETLQRFVTHLKAYRLKPSKVKK